MSDQILQKALTVAVKRIPTDVVPGFSMDMMEFPSFFKPENIYNPFYQPNLQAAMEEGLRLRKRLRKLAYQQELDGQINILTMIDLQKDFMDYYRFVQEVLKLMGVDGLYGRLPVNGALDDVFRLCLRIIRGIFEEYYTQFLATFDWHPDFAVHQSCNWQNDKRDYPDIGKLALRMVLQSDGEHFECVSADGSESQGLFKPALNRKWTTEEYAPHLKKTGQGDIWVFTNHCLQASDGAMMVPALKEVLVWACATRGIRMANLYKGHVPEVDWFGPFFPCMEYTRHPQATLQSEYLDKYKNATNIEIAEEAEDFCGYWGNQQTMEYHKDNPKVLKATKILDNCKSPIVPNDPKVAAQRIAAEGMGVTFIKHDTPFNF